MILCHKSTVLSPWVTLVKKTVQFKKGPASYHCLQQNDYVTVLAVREDGKIPIVRQFRAAIERFTWELPGGIVDDGQTPLQACQQELREEAGLLVREAYDLGSHFPDAGRLQNKIHSFFVTAHSLPTFKPEDDVEPDYVDWPTLLTMIRTGDFASSLHISTLFLATHHPQFLCHVMREMKGET